MKEFKYVVTDPEGIHARPAGILVKQAAGYTCKENLRSDGAWRKNRRRSYDYSRR